MCKKLTNKQHGQQQQQQRMANKNRQHRKEEEEKARDFHSRVSLINVIQHRKTNKHNYKQTYNHK